MKVSVVSPSFNQGQFIQTTVESVAEQEYRDKEHLIVDAGSSDGSVDIICQACDKYSHVRAVIEPDRGQADAINKGLAATSGEVLAWLNTDDHYSDPGVIGAVVGFFSQHPAVDVVWGRGMRVGPDGRNLREAWIQPPNTDFTVALQHSMGLLQPSVFFRRSVFETVGGLSEEYPLQLDYEYWIRIANAGFTFGFLDRLLSRAVVHADAKSTAMRMEQLNECLRLVEEKFGYVPVQWIRRFSEFFLTRQDRKVTRGLKLTSDQQAEQLLIDRALLTALNGNERARTILRTARDLEPYEETRRALSFHGLARSPLPRRVVITSFDSAYFQQGLNLVAALHRMSLASFDEIVVYSLGLTSSERARLDSLDKVKVRDYPAEAQEFFPEYLEPKTRAYKACAIRSGDPHVRDGDLVLWMDAGLAPLKDIDVVFNHIAEQEFFITDHDDTPLWPNMRDINFAHRASHDALGLTNAELLQPHLCSALLGYVRGGTYQHIIDEAYRLSQIRHATVWPKIPAPGDTYRPTLSTEETALRDALLDGRKPAESVSRDTLLSLFPYFGHRTQTTFSSLVHRARAPVFSARTYRRSNARSSQAAIDNWSKTAHDTDLLSSDAALDDMDASVVVYHHRGILHNLEGLRYKRSGDALFVVGNGPSFREFPFSALNGQAWLGMNAAYRYWERVGIYPTYYSCLDETVLESHAAAVVGLVENGSRLGIQRFFLRRSLLEHYPGLEDDPAVWFLEDLQRELPRWFPEDKVTTGSVSVLAGWALGYREMFLLGIDLNYVEELAETVVEGRTLTLAADPSSNPNYFFSDYQRKGDRYNPPNRHPGLHLRAWDQTHALTEDFPLTITNLNPDSAVRAFAFEDYGSALKRLVSRERLPERLAQETVQRSREREYWRQRLLQNLSAASHEETQPGEHENAFSGLPNLERMMDELSDLERAAADRIERRVAEIAEAQRSSYDRLEEAVDRL